LTRAYLNFGGAPRFHGMIQTLRLWEDNVLVRKTLETPGDRRVLVIDGGASLRHALLGGQLGVLAQDNGWAGIVVHGCIRDVAELAQCQVGIQALGSVPRRSRRNGLGEQGNRLDIVGVAISPGHWCYVDEDGVLISDLPLT
jgi:regulator of ribonuclease activity A